MASYFKAFEIAGGGNADLSNRKFNVVSCSRRFTIDEEAR